MGAEALGLLGFRVFEAFGSGLGFGCLDYGLCFFGSLGLGFRASGFGLGTGELLGPPWVHPLWAFLRQYLRGFST